jgi:hypothetical protein
LTAGILVQGDRLPRLVNNIITRAGSALGTAVEVIEARSVAASASPLKGTLILSNIFGGWQRTLRVSHVPGLGLPPTEIGTATVLNSADGDGFGGPISGNKIEPSTTTFSNGAAGTYALARSSASLDAGTDLTAAGGPGGTGPILLRSGKDISMDYLGNPRPAPVQLEVPGPPRGWDIGAFEYSE